ncbi:MAG: hypothetical protein IPK63_10140 [Candidatus Competibacteraceae bacterium]|nr:hypothetical protein [Candidatus Competibacteraceae bacterium]
MRKTIENGWSRNVLAHQIDSRLYERQAEKPRIDHFAERLPAPQFGLARETFKDSYVFDLLSVGDHARERTLETMNISGMETTKQFRP